MPAAGVEKGAGQGGGSNSLGTLLKNGRGGEDGKI